MLVLKTPKATPEQLRVISGTRLGVEVIRGAAGSGKTSTALLRLNSLAQLFLARRKRMGLESEVKVLVLTFNRTLAGYVEHLAASQMAGKANVNYEVSTFAAWAVHALPKSGIADSGQIEQRYLPLLEGLGLPMSFLISEIDYICGRFRPNRRADYLACERAGRGATPAVPRAIRPTILAKIEEFYRDLHADGLVDWHDITEQMLRHNSMQYDVVIIDEAQDFAANQIRAIGHHLAPEHCLTLVMDTVQRLYPRGFTWIETGLDMKQATYHRLAQNHRNTVEIAQFASGIIDGIHIDDDGTMPDFAAATRHGARPTVYEGLYREQAAFAIESIRNSVDLKTETVAFLKPKGGQWFDFLREQLAKNKIPFVELTRDRGWPQGAENVALSTMHSAKGLEFDHVYILGLNDDNAPLGEDAGDESSLQLRRLLAMAVGRARKGVIVGFKPGEASKVMDYFKAGTYELRRAAR